MYSLKCCLGTRRHTRLWNSSIVSKQAIPWKVSSVVCWFPICAGVPQGRGVGPIMFSHLVDSSQLLPSDLPKTQCYGWSHCVSKAVFNLLCLIGGSSASFPPRLELTLKPALSVLKLAY